MIATRIVSSSRTRVQASDEPLVVLGIERVALVGAVDRDDGDAVVQHVEGRWTLEHPF
jgi:hypothetical protein